MTIERSLARLLAAELRAGQTPISAETRPEAAASWSAR